MTVKEIKRLPFEIDTKSIIVEDDFFIFEGYASTFGNVDLGDDVIAQGAFTKTLLATPEVPILWQHQMSNPIGMSFELREDLQGLYVKGRLPKADRDVYGKVIPQMKVGSIKEMSIGFFTKESDYKEGGIRVIKEIELFEISLVTKAMNPQALVSSFKSMDSLKDVEQSLKEMGLSNTEAKTLISKVKEFSIQRDAEEKQVQREAEEKATILTAMEELTNLINKKH